MGDASNVFVLQVRRSRSAGRDYFYAQWDESEIPDTTVYNVLVDIGESRGGSILGVYRKSSLFKVIKEAIVALRKPTDRHEFVRGQTFD